MTYVVTAYPEAQAIGLCWLARHEPTEATARLAGKGGLPDIPVLRGAVVQLHPEPCGWCEYPPDELLAMLRGRHVLARDETGYWALPGKARLAAIRAAQGRAE